MTAQQTEPLTRAEQARQTRQNVLDVALALFAQQGYDATSLQDIADEVGLTKAAVYYHFRSKVTILQALCEPVYDAMKLANERAAALGSHRRRVQALTDSFIEVLLKHRTMMSVLANDPIMHGQLKAVGTMDDLLADSLRLLYGEHPTVDQRLAVYSASGFSAAVSIMPEVPDDELRPALARAMKRLLPAKKVMRCLNTGP
jgi:AcrR family transcriptional regulator